MATILIVEDDKNTQLLTSARLRVCFNVICANDGAEALDIIYSKSVDLIVADIMMPKIDGYTLVKTLREENNLIPIILLTAKQSFEAKREGFNLGSDDYMTKPIDYEELILRINALLRRAKISTDRKITIGDTIIDSSAYTIFSNNEYITLAKKEFDLLFKLLSYPNVIFTKNQLLDELWGLDSFSGEDTIKTHINRLRNKLKCITDFEIITLKGIGYKINITKPTVQEK